MDRAHFDHVLFAVGDATGAAEIVVIGSQALLGSVAAPPESLLRSMEADVFVPGDPAKSDVIDAFLGDGSAFSEAFGYYAHGVGPETLVAPGGWEARLVPFEVSPRGASTRTIVARCLEPHDLVLSKCAAGRERDWDYAWSALDSGVVQLAVLLERLRDLPVPDGTRERIAALLNRPR